MRNKQRLRMAVIFCVTVSLLTGCASKDAGGQEAAVTEGVTEGVTEVTETAETVTEMTEQETESQEEPANASMHTENEKMELAGLDTTPEGWGWEKRPMP